MINPFKPYILNEVQNLPKTCSKTIRDFQNYEYNHTSDIKERTSYVPVQELEESSIIEETQS